MHLSFQQTNACDSSSHKNQNMKLKKEKKKKKNKFLKKIYPKFKKLI